MPISYILAYPMIRPSLDEE